MSGSAVARRALIILTMLSALCASAQERGFDVHRYDGSTAGSWLFMVDRPWYSGTRYFAVGLTADGALNPLVPAIATGRGAATPIISLALLGHVDVAGSFLDRILLRASLPVTLLERGTPEPVSGAQPSNSVVLGDPRVGFMVRLFGQPERDGFSLHLGGDVWFPVGAQNRNEGDRAMRFLPRVVMAGAADKFRWNVEAGFLIRSYASIGPPTLGMTAASEGRLGAAVGFALLDERVYIGPEVQFSSQVFGANAFQVNGMSLEALLGAQVLIGEHVQLGIAAGAGFLGAAGTPDARALVRVAWAPRHNPATVLELQVQADLVDAGSLPSGDADFDGVPNDPDRCPYEAENWNGVRDDDGCPEYMMPSTSALAKVLVSESPLSVADAGVRDARREKAAAAQRVDQPPGASAQAMDAGARAPQPLMENADAGVAKREPPVEVVNSRGVDAGVAKREPPVEVVNSRGVDAGVAKREPPVEVVSVRGVDAGVAKREPPVEVVNSRGVDAGVAKREPPIEVVNSRGVDAGVAKREPPVEVVNSRGVDAGAAKREPPPVEPVAAVDAGVVVTASNALDLIGAGLLVAATLDSDGDGLADEADRCPVQPEDFDDFEDEDGCPELDNDRDGIADLNDRCPLEAETPNGIDDDDGCPDVAPDADQDTLADSADRCPFEPETFDGVRDDDGCPEYQGPSRPALAALIAPPVVTPESEPTPEKIEAALEFGRGDADKDGLVDDADRCPITPEDLDGFEDEDGCPEPDNDGDSIADAKDRCPDEAETVNGWEDEDGCPDVHQDLDGDGLLYDADRCPFEPGDATDGCPHVALPKLALPGFPGMPASVEKPAGPTDVTPAPSGMTPAPSGMTPPPSGMTPAPSDVTPAPTETTPVAVAAADLDGDQTPDEADRCPVSAEDADGFEDEDGCPEPDNDADGIPDSKDKCPFAAETINGVKDDDGCPDKGASKVSIEGEHVVIKGVILFRPGSAKLTGASMPLLKQVAATLNSAKSITVEVQGHTDDVGSAAKNIRLSKQRADAIRAVLIKAGVAENRLIANGYGPTRPVASNKTAKGREKNRRVEFLILGESK